MDKGIGQIANLDLKDSNALTEIQKIRTETSFAAREASKFNNVLAKGLSDLESKELSAATFGGAEKYRQASQDIVRVAKNISTSSDSASKKLFSLREQLSRISAIANFDARGGFIGSLANPLVLRLKGLALS